MAQQGSESADFSCVNSLELPTRGLFAARAPGSGSVRAMVTIGKEGTLSKMQFTTDGPAPQVLEAEVRVALDSSRFEQRCSGRTLEFVFSFRVEDPPTDFILPPAVRFQPPNHFELVFRRVKANLDPTPPQKR